MCEVQDLPLLLTEILEGEKLPALHLFVISIVAHKHYPISHIYVLLPKPFISITFLSSLILHIYLLNLLFRTTHLF